MRGMQQLMEALLRVLSVYSSAAERVELRAG